MSALDRRLKAHATNFVASWCGPENTDDNVHFLFRAEGFLTNSELGAVLERIGADSPDAAVIKQAIDWLDEIAVEITKVADLLVEANFSFGKIET
jgi:hypothetical protein